MSDKPTIHEALSAVMGDVQAIGKKDRNEQQRFMFRGIDAVVNAVGPALRTHRVVVLPHVHAVTYDNYTTSKGTAMRSAVVDVEFTFYGPGGDSLACRTLGEASDAGDKAVSKAHSVAFRTALLQALCIPTDEPDPDASSHERAAPEQRIPTALVQRVRKAASTEELQGMFRERFGCAPASVPASRAVEVEDWLSDLEAP